MRKPRTKPKKLEKILYYPKKNYRNAIRILKLLSENEFLTTQSIAERLGKRWENPHSRTNLQLQYLTELGYCLEFGLVTNAKHPCNHCKSTSYLVAMKSIKSALHILNENKKHRDEAKKSNPEKFKPSDWFDCEERHVLGRLISLTCSECYKLIDPHMDEPYKIRDYHYWCLSNNGLYIMLGILKKEDLYAFLERFKTDRILELIDVLFKSQKKEIVDRLIASLKITMKMVPYVGKITTSWFNETKASMHDDFIDSNKYPLLSNYYNKHRWEREQENIMNARRFR